MPTGSSAERFQNTRIFKCFKGNGSVMKYFKGRIPRNDMYNFRLHTEIYGQYILYVKYTNKMCSTKM